MAAQDRDLPEGTMMAEDQVARIYAELSEGFGEAERRLQAKGNLIYIPIAEVIQRLNTVLGVNAWSYEVRHLEHHAQEVPDFVVAHVRLTATIDGVVVQRDGVGGQKVNRTSKGNIIDLGDDHKGAVSDAL